jgi:hypothetical protein
MINRARAQMRRRINAPVLHHLTLLRTLALAYAVGAATVWHAVLGGQIAPAGMSASITALALLPLGFVNVAAMLWLLVADTLDELRS